jgi:3-methyladenine DNA glycosylase AlkD
MNSADLINELQKLSNPEKAKNLQRFFKTGKGQYGEGDIFLGIIVPLQRKTADKFKDFDLKQLRETIKSKYHEARLTSLIILTEKFKKAEEKEKKEIVDFYLKNTKYINNWDLVDLSAVYILGQWFFDKDKEVLYKLAKSGNLWERRISIISTAWFIKNYSYGDTIKISKLLLKDKHDLIHKAVGWMLREVGKRNLKTETDFLDKYSKAMPRTMLRYAIEKFPKTKQKGYLS